MQSLIDTDFILTSSEVRVLGVMMEKQITTPTYYPMTPNSLVNGSNQKNSRHPIVAFNESLVSNTLGGMRDRRLVNVVHESGARGPKYAQLLTRELRLEPDEHAILCVLMLRGAQTVGELRGRCEPIHGFSSLESVEHTLSKLAARPVKPLVLRLERLPGSRDARWAHTLMGAEGIAAMQADFVGSSAAVMATPGVDAVRMDALEVEVRALRAELDEIKAQLGI